MRAQVADPEPPRAAPAATVNQFRRRHSVKIRHVDIHEYNIGLMPYCQIECFAAICSLGNDEEIPYGYGIVSLAELQRRVLHPVRLCRGKPEEGN